MTGPGDLKEARTSRSDRGLVLVGGAPATDADGHVTTAHRDQPGSVQTPIAPENRPLDTRKAANEAWAAARLLASQTGALVRTLSANSWRHLQTVARRASLPLRSYKNGGVHTEAIREPAAYRRRSSKFVRAIALWSAVIALIGGTLLYLIATIPVDGGLRADPTPSALTIQSERGDPFATRGVFKGERLSSADLSPHLAKAIVAIEDRRFFEHIGIDLRGTLRAAWRNAQAGGTREGGSTITQQLARLLFLSPERSVRRKIQEALVALWLESQLSKEEILLRYLNTAFFGAGAYGADAAAKRYFGKRARDLSLAEAAMLAGLVRAPSQLAPTRNFGGAKERAETVLQAMVESGAITTSEAETARAQPINLRTPTETPPGTSYFVDMVAADVRRLLGSASGDMTLRTTIDLNLQRLAEAIIERRLEVEGARKDVSQAALVAMRPDGAVVALVGGRDYEQSQFNRATQAKRQAGSLFKLFVYLAAFQRGYTPQTVLVDRPVQIGDWEPQNASGRFKGAVNLRSAFAQSINTIAAQIADEMGVAPIIDTAKRLGVHSILPAVPSLALGTADVTLMEMTRAFAAVAAGVQSVEPYAITAITGGTQQSLYIRPNTGPEVTGQLGESRVMMLDLLQAVVNEGTGRAARLKNVTVAGKTGTSQEYRDAWFVGFTPELVVGVWVGNDDNSPMNKVTGGDLPATIWRDFVSRAQTPASPAVAQQSSPPSTGSVKPAGRSPGVIRGVARVLETDKLDINGTVLQLHGVEPAGSRMASQLARYLRRQEVTCTPSHLADRYRCRVGTDDLSELILAGGGARATEDATSELLSAEEQARSMRLGVWRRGG